MQRIDTPFQERTAGIWGNRNFDVAAERGGAGTAEEVAGHELGSMGWGEGRQQWESILARCVMEEERYFMVIMY